MNSANLFTGALRGSGVLRVLAVTLLALGAGLAKASTVMVIAPHPDDEVLLSAGRIRAAVTAGDTVKVVVVTNGDIDGSASGYQRQAETVAAMRALGLSEQDVIFLGYGDGLMRSIYDSSSGSQVYTSAAGQSATYGSRGLGGMDYHRYQFGVPGPYSRDTVLQDVESVLAIFRPDAVFTLSPFDEHGDHQATGLFTTEGLVHLQRGGAALPTQLYQGLIWMPCTVSWPDQGGFTPLLPFTRPPCLGSTPLEWERIERFPVPAEMRSSVATDNLKYAAVQLSSAQGDPRYLGYVRKDEFFWHTDVAHNLGLLATVTASSQDLGQGGAALNAVDEIWNGRAGHEWSALGEAGGAWIQLSWAQPVRLSLVTLHDLLDPDANVLAGTLSFSDGSALSVGALPSNGAAFPVVFSTREVSWVRFTIDRAAGTRTGLSEFRALGTLAGAAGNSPPTLLWGPVASPEALPATATSSLSVAATDLDGDLLQYRWTADGGSIAGTGTTATFTPPAVTSAAVVTVTTQVTDSKGNSVNGTAFVTVTAPTLSGLSLSPASVTGGTPATGTITLASPAPAGGISVALSSSTPAVASVPATVTVAAGASSATFTVATVAPSATTSTTITASRAGVTFAANLTVNPRGVPTATNLARTATVTVSSENTGTGQLGTKAIDGSATGYPTDYTKEWATLGQLAGAWIRLTWGTPVTVSQVKLFDRPNLSDQVLGGTLLFSDGSTVPVGTLPNAGTASTIDFTARVVNWVQLRVDAANGSNIGLAEFEVYGYAGGAFSISTIAVSPRSVTGGTSSVGTVTLASRAPAGGAVVGLSSSNASVASVPASVTVLAGARTATFGVTTAAVPLSTSVTLSASGGGRVAQSTTLVVKTVPVNAARNAKVTVSSENAATGQLGVKAIDGYVGSGTREWATVGQLAGAWIQLNWSSPTTTSRVRLFDRPSLIENVLGGTLLFSDGSSVAVGALPNGGGASTVTFAARSVSWVRFRVDRASGLNVGLAEFEVYNE